MEEEIKEYQTPDKMPEPSPLIDPNLVKETFNLLASKGFIHFTETGAYIPTERGWKLLRKVKTVRERIIGFGSEKIKASSEDSLKFVKGEKIDGATLVIKCNKGCDELSEEFKSAIREGAFLEVVIRVGLEEEKITAYGSPALKILGDEVEIRKDDKITDGTIGIMASKSAKEIKGKMLENLKRGKEVEIELVARI